MVKVMPTPPRRPKETVANGNCQGSEVKKTVRQKRALEDSDGPADTLSKNKQKKRSRNPNKNFSPQQKRECYPPTHAVLQQLNVKYVTMSFSFLSQPSTSNVSSVGTQR